jgi:UDP-glucose 4-epimerase
VRILVTGAAGFIGSTTSEMLLDEGHEVVALDNLSRGHRDNVPARAQFVEGDCGDPALIESLGRFDACIHFAARIEPGDSMVNPEVFFDNNVGATFRLLRALVDSGTPKFVFSSSCAVYGDRVTIPIDEDHPTAPHSPYGLSKLMVEQGLSWFVSQGRLRAASLRYFNAAGGTLAHPERHHPEIHLIPLTLAAAAGDRPQISIFGDDYPTVDGTCVRDYIHVSDLARAHVLAITALDQHPEIVVNLGTGHGYSNRQIVDSVREITGRDFTVVMTARRPGDPAAAVAANQRAHDLLGWTLEKSDLTTIITDAWAAYQS